MTDFFSVGAYDVMAAIVQAVQATKGKMDGDAAVKSLLGWKFDSPQGPIMIDPETRDIVMNEYLSEVVMGKDGKLHEKQLAVVNNVKDQCKCWQLAPVPQKSEDRSHYQNVVLKMRTSAPRWVGRHWKKSALSKNRLSEYGFTGNAS